ncbi:fic family toxin-antitoxin system, toxin component [Streptomyces sp. NPDC058268]|uniref:fic family toxin-antitoxin system, toxin component n=1 Tax=Streptomyces sp. NPDC058268 TaxID=3346413 RepID=UPI0036E59592
MAFVLIVDERWLLEAAQSLVPGDPDVTDHGAIGAAVARHRHTVMGTLIYELPHHRAAALLHSLARVPALEHSNELFAAQVAYAYLHASGIKAEVSSKDAVALVAAVVEGRLGVREVAAALKTWS